LVLENNCLIELKNVSKFYKKGENKLLALDSFNFCIYESEILSVIGRSGSGKSTLLNLIGGLDKPTNGKILYDGKNISEFDQKELASYRKLCVGMIFQSFNLINTYSALDNVILALTFGGVSKNERKEKAKYLLDQVGLSKRFYHKPSELSGGEAQRVGIARAMANNPHMILADEPTGNLDSTTSNEIIEILHSLNKNHGITIILVTHDQEIAENVSHRYIRLMDGRIVEQKNLHS